MKIYFYFQINIHSTTDTEGLYKYVLQKNLPTEAGGKCGAINDYESKIHIIFGQFYKIRKMKLIFYSLKKKNERLIFWKSTEIG